MVAARALSGAHARHTARFVAARITQAPTLDRMGSFVVRHSALVIAEALDDVTVDVQRFLTRAAVRYTKGLPDQPV
jgi:hypothetical protein